MFCNACGSPMTADQQFCARCGKAAGVLPPPLPAPQSRANHLRVLGILWLAVSAFRLLPGLVFLGMGPFWLAFVPPEVRPFVVGIAGMLGIFFLTGAVLGFIAGWGLLERRPWSRTLTIVLGVLSLLDFPLGTALGIYTLWVLLPAQTEQEFRGVERVA